MTGDQRPPSGDADREAQLRAATERSRELQATHRRLALRHAEVEERAGQVHDEAARVHEGLGASRLLDPAQLSAHAERARDRAAIERRRAAPEPDVTEPEVTPPDVAAATREAPPSDGDRADEDRADEGQAPPAP